jgi:hypothetical protein
VSSTDMGDEVVEADVSRKEMGCSSKDLQSRDWRGAGCGWSCPLLEGSGFWGPARVTGGRPGGGGGQKADRCKPWWRGWTPMKAWKPMAGLDGSSMGRCLGLRLLHVAGGNPLRPPETVMTSPCTQELACTRGTPIHLTVTASLTELSFWQSQLIYAALLFPFLFFSFSGHGVLARFCTHGLPACPV